MVSSIALVDSHPVHSRIPGVERRLGSLPLSLSFAVVVVKGHGIKHVPPRGWKPALVVVSPHGGHVQAGTRVGLRSQSAIWKCRECKGGWAGRRGPLEVGGVCCVGWVSRGREEVCGRGSRAGRVANIASPALPQVLQIRFCCLIQYKNPNALTLMLTLMP